MDPTKVVGVTTLTGAEPVDVEGQGQRDLVDGLRRRQMQQSWLAGWKGHLGKNGVEKSKATTILKRGDQSGLDFAATIKLAWVRSKSFAAEKLASGFLG